MRHQHLAWLLVLAASAFAVYEMMEWSAPGLAARKAAQVKS
jgi:hypothetical protein